MAITHQLRDNLFGDTYYRKVPSTLAPLGCYWEISMPSCKWETVQRGTLIGQDIRMTLTLV
jgi:hypothetical protein